MTEEFEIKRALGRLLGPGEPEVGCDDCFAELDRYVELELAGVRKEHVDDDALRSGELVEQARLSDVGPADECDLGKRGLHSDQRVGKRPDKFDRRRLQWVGLRGCRV